MRATSDQPARPPEAWMAAALLFVLGSGSLVWTSGQLAARLWHDTWLPVPWSSAPGLGIGALVHVGAPRAAWPASVRADLPPPAVLDGVTAGVAVMVLSVAAAVVWCRHLRYRRGTPPRAAWARRADLAPLRVRGPHPGRLTLGTAGRALLAAEARASLVVLGPSQSGKTSGLAVPAILEWAGPVVATSVKTDLVGDTLAHRQRLGTTWIYDPTASTGYATATWTPVAGCAEWHRARRVAAWLCSAARSRSPSTSDDDFWYAAAGKLIAPHLFAAAIGRRTMADVVRWLDVQEEEEVAGLLDRAGVEEATAAANASWGRDERTRSSIYATAEIVLEAFADPAVLASSRTSDIQPQRLVDGPASTLYLCAPSHEQERLRPVFSALLSEVLIAAFTRAAREGHGLDPPLLIILDEAANIAPLRELDVLASTAAGHGVQLVTVWQDLAQIQARYGERAATVVNNHRAKIILSGISDPATLDYASRLLGDGDVREASVTTDDRGHRTTTRSSRERRLLTDAELRRLAPYEGVLVYGHLQPARLRLRPWFEGRRRNRATMAR